MKVIWSSLSLELGAAHAYTTPFDIRTKQFNLWKDTFGNSEEVRVGQECIMTSVLTMTILTLKNSWQDSRFVFFFLGEQVSYQVQENDKLLYHCLQSKTKKTVQQTMDPERGHPNLKVCPLSQTDETTTENKNVQVSVIDQKSNTYFNYFYIISTQLTL